MSYIAAPSEPRPPIAVRAAGSSVWSLIGQVFQVVLGLASFALLSRWLTPVDYGLMAMAATVSGFVGVIGDAGVSSTIVRIPNLDATAEATAFWLSFAGAGVLFVISAIAAPIIAWFYKNDSITSLSLGLATTFILAAPGRVSTAKLARQLRFRATTLINIVANTVAAGLAVALASLGYGAWALVVQMAATFALQAALAVVVSPPQTRLALVSRKQGREFAAFGSQLSGYSLAITVARTPDSILAGRFLGSSSVGFMAVGTRLVFSPVERLCGAIYSVFLPAHVELGDVAEQARAFQSTARLLLMIVGPFALGTISVAWEIAAFLPITWARIPPLLIVYAVTSLVLPLNYLSLSVLIGHGRANILLRLAVAQIPVSWLGAVVGALSRSVLVMVCAWSASIVLGAATLFWFAWRQLDLRRQFWASMVAPLAISSGMALGVRSILHLTGLGGTRTGFVVGAAIGAVLYGVLLWVVMRAEVIRVANLLKRALTGRKVGLVSKSSPANSSDG